MNTFLQAYLQARRQFHHALMALMRANGAGVTSVIAKMQRKARECLHALKLARGAVDPQGTDKTLAAQLDREWQEDRSDFNDLIAGKTDVQIGADDAGVDAICYGIVFGATSSTTATYNAAYKTAKVKIEDIKKAIVKKQADVKKYNTRIAAQEVEIKKLSVGLVVTRHIPGPFPGIPAPAVFILAKKHKAALMVLKDLQKSRATVRKQISVLKLQIVQQQAILTRNPAQVPKLRPGGVLRPGVGRPGGSSPGTGAQVAAPGGLTPVTQPTGGAGANSGALTPGRLTPVAPTVAAQPVSEPLPPMAPPSETASPAAATMLDQGANAAQGAASLEMAQADLVTAKEELTATQKAVAVYPEGSAEQQQAMGEALQLQQTVDQLTAQLTGMGGQMEGLLSSTEQSFKQLGPQVEQEGAFIETSEGSLSTDDIAELQDQMAMLTSNSDEGFSGYGDASDIFGRVVRYGGDDYGYGEDVASVVQAAGSATKVNQGVSAPSGDGLLNFIGGLAQKGFDVASTAISKTGAAVKKGKKDNKNAQAALASPQQQMQYAPPSVEADHTLRNVALVGGGAALLGGAFWLWSSSRQPAGGGASANYFGQASIDEYGGIEELVFADSCEV